MKPIFAYKRLDGQFGVCLVDECSEAYQKSKCTHKFIVDSSKEFKLLRVKSLKELECSNRDDRPCEYSCNDVEYILKDGEAWVKLQNSNSNLVVEISLQLFNNDLVCVENSVTIKSVTWKISVSEVQNKYVISSGKKLIRYFQQMMRINISQIERNCVKSTLIAFLPIGIFSLRYAERIALSRITSMYLIWLSVSM